MSPTRPAPPDFRCPPVVEVALSAQFEPLKSLGTPQIGLLWLEFKDRFPRTEEHPPLEPAIERFGVRGVPTPAFRLEMVDLPPARRIWFLNEAGTELIQVQQDRFVHNWRKVGEGPEYPRYERIRETFQRELRTFHSFVEREGLGALTPNQCEVTYVNHVVADAEWTSHGQLDRVITVFSPLQREALLPEAEDVRLALRYVIPDRDGVPLGRLHVTIDPVYRTSDDRPMYLVKLTARGRPDGDGIQGILRFLDTGREWAGRGFLAITTAHMHKMWGREDDH